MSWEMLSQEGCGKPGQLAADTVHGTGQEDLSCISPRDTTRTTEKHLTELRERNLKLDAPPGHWTFAHDGSSPSLHPPPPFTWGALTLLPLLSKVMSSRKPP